jgi:hypothetical protein
VYERDPKPAHRHVDHPTILPIQVAVFSEPPGPTPTRRVTTHWNVIDGVALLTRRPLATVVHAVTTAPLDVPCGTVRSAPYPSREVGALLYEHRSRPKRATAPHSPGEPLAHTECFRSMAQCSTLAISRAGIIDISPVRVMSRTANANRPSPQCAKAGPVHGGLRDAAAGRSLSDDEPPMGRPLRRTGCQTPEPIASPNRVILRGSGDTRSELPACAPIPVRGRRRMFRRTLPRY